ncbi:hypothetical protein [Ideonella sp. YS5]|uniref:hypothetical protein n=1 Tax=Ideonella sp. YS5 TaxID=3453714 RepID=UPI003EEE96D1
MAFADGSMLVNSCAANGFATDLSGTAQDDLLLGATHTTIDRVSETNARTAPDADANSATVSADGRYVVFASASTNLGAGGDTNGDSDIFLKDLQTGIVTRVSTTSAGKQAVSTGYGSISPVISADGRYVVFRSDATNLVAGDTNGAGDIFRKDLVTGEVKLITSNAAGVQANSESMGASVSADGRYVAFSSYASNLMPGDPASYPDIYVKDTLTGQLVLASSSADGAWGNGSSGGYGSYTRLSADGRYVMFDSTSSNLVEGDQDGISELFVKDLQTGKVECVDTDIHGNFLPGVAATGNLSADGRHVVFSTGQDVMYDGQDGPGSVYLRDLQTGELQRVVPSGGEGQYYPPAVSADGRFVVFSSTAALVATDTNGVEDVYVKDTTTGALARVSVGAAGEQASSGAFQPDISDDGSTIVLTATGSELTGGSPGGVQQVFTVANPLVGWTLRGGAGDDVYQISQPNVIVENVGEGTDTVRASISYVMVDNLERLELTGNAAINGQGNALANEIKGNGAANIIAGGGGDDTLDGAGGSDTASYEDATGGVTVSLALTGTQNTGGDGIDRLANFENLLGSAYGDSLTGTSAGNLLDGGHGADTLTGGAGNDVYVVDNAGDLTLETASGGSDEVRAWTSVTLQDSIENLTLAGSSAINGTGNGLSNTITGNSAGNVLDGGAGADTLVGGEGGDTYIIDNAGDKVTETGDSGVDQAFASVSFTLPSGVQTLTLTGTAAINATGNTENQNKIVGNAGANVLDDGGGNYDTLVGGAGDDTYILHGGIVSAIEAANGGVDTVYSSGRFTLGGELENLVLTGTSSIAGEGNGKNNRLTGNSGANYLDGGAGIDTMEGGAGDDRYVVDSTQDVITERAGEGSDSVRSWISWTLGANLESLELTGEAEINGTGNAQNNTLSGDFSANVLDGGVGADTMYGGGGGADTFIVDNAADLVSGDGDDLILSSVSFSLDDLSEVTHLTLTGSAAINGTGSYSADVLVGNAAGNVLDGNAGLDTMTGGAGDDTYIVDNAGDKTVELAGGGTDLVTSSITSTLQAEVENLTLTGMSEINGTGNALANVITGNQAANAISGAAGNDTLNGAAGADNLTGGTGDDTYIVDSTGDKTVELAGGGIDLVQSSVGLTLQAEIEKLTLTGSSAINGTGNSLANTITGNSAANVLDGGAGADTMTGGAGDDTYVVDNAADKTIEAAAGGTDAVQSSASFTLQAEIEKLTLTGAAAINGTGNSLANTITGNAAVNALDGAAGNDTLNGAGGADSLTGGAGDDTYIIDNAADKTVEIAGGGTDLVQSSITFSLQSEVEKLTLTGSSAINGTGNTLANTIIGNAGANVLNGGSGADTLTGGGGSDTYVVDNVGDKTVELAAGGTDLVQSSVGFTLQAEVENLVLTGTSAINGIGNALANVITGNAATNAISGDAGNDTLDGAAGADSLTGGAGNDTYVVDNAADKTVEVSGGGTDLVQSSVSFTLQAEVENLTLTGTGAINGSGNTLANTITGNTAANVLNGGAGIDTLTGGAGNDTYVADNVSDKTIEISGGGTDLVRSSVSFTLQAEVENLTLTGTAAINGTGNTLANTITGNTAANVLNGGIGNDTMTGGAGNDTYIVDNAADKIIEVTGGGIDAVQSSLSFTLQAEVENLTLTGTAALNGSGNALANKMVGNGAANTLDGQAGADTLTGGAGADVFAFSTALASDVITDFTHGADKIRLSQAAIHIGDGDTLVEGAVSVSGPNGFASNAELVIVNHDIAGAITTTNAAAAIGHANTAYATGDTRLFVVDNGSDSAIYLFKAADTNSIVSANELTLVATLDNTANTTVGDYLFGA